MHHPRTGIAIVFQILTHCVYESLEGDRSGQRDEEPFHHADGDTDHASSGCFQQDSAESPDRRLATCPTRSAR